MKQPQYFEIEKNMINLIAQKYQRTEESFQEDVTTLKNWIKTQRHLPEILDDKRIQNFLITNKCSIERANQKIDMYYTLRSLIPDMFENMNPRCANMKQIIEIAAWVTVPQLTKDMYRVVVWKMRNKDLIDKLEPHDLMRQFINLQEIRLIEDVMYGDVFIYDMEGVNFGYMTKLTPSLVAKMVAMYEKIFSMRVKAAYFINAPSFVNALMTLLKSVMKPKLFDRIIVSTNSSILQKYIPKELLLKDYGGEAPSLDELCELLKDKLHQYQDRFDVLDKLRVNEDLRPEKLKNDDVLGFYGNFKKLDVD